VAQREAQLIIILACDQCRFLHFKDHVLNRVLTCQHYAMQQIIPHVASATIHSFSFPRGGEKEHGYPN
jgi:hypothetical protein